MCAGIFLRFVLGNNQNVNDIQILQKKTITIITFFINPLLYKVIFDYLKTRIIFRNDSTMLISKSENTKNARIVVLISIAFGIVIMIMMDFYTACIRGDDFMRFHY